MKFKQTRTVYDDLYLTDETINHVAIHRLEQLVGKGFYLSDKDGKFIIVKDEERGSCFSSEYVRDATDLDIAVFKVLTALRNHA